MANIVQVGDFKGEISIANKEQDYIQTDITALIVKYEKAYLLALLGPDLYALFIAGLAADPVLDKWTVLKDKIGSAIADYIYWYYSKDRYTQTVGVGETQAKAQNATIVSPRAKLMRAWNEMYDLSITAANFIAANEADYGSWYITREWLKVNERPEIFDRINEFDF